MSLSDAEKIELTLDCIEFEFGADRKEVESSCYIEVKDSEVHVKEGMGGSVHVYKILKTDKGINYADWYKEISNEKL